MPLYVSVAIELGTSTGTPGAARRSTAPDRESPPVASAGHPPRSGLSALEVGETLANSADVPPPSLEILTTDECFELLGRMPVGRIAVTVDALPVVLPVNFAVLDGAIVFRTIEGTKLAAATSGSVVAFEVDGYEPDGRSGWSVMVQGVSTEVTEPDQLERVRQAGVDSWALDGTADRVVRIGMHVVTGRRFSR